MRFPCAGRNEAANVLLRNLARPDGAGRAAELGMRLSSHRIMEKEGKSHWNLSSILFVNQRWRTMNAPWAFKKRKKV